MISKTERTICGTCEYWTGKRNPIFDKNGTPKVDICDEQGQCQNQNSRFIDTVRGNSACCVHYSKWTEIL